MEYGTTTWRIIGPKARRKKHMKHLPSITKLTALIVFGLMLAIIPSQAINQHPTSPPQRLFDPYFTWQDNFETEEHIDPLLSHDYELNNGKVGIQNTIPAWLDPTWTRLKPITLINNASILTDYAVHLTIAYDTDMRPDYGDLRFKHQDFITTWLDYWIEDSDNATASIWVKIPSIPHGTSTLYLFYGNPIAETQSDYYSVFTTWQEAWPNDERITYHSNDEGAWDPEIDYGANTFLVLWEEGQAFYPPYTWGYKQEIRGSLYNLDGTQIITDQQIFNDNTFYYHNENPSAVYGTDRFFVAWEHYATNADPSITTMDIMGRTVQNDNGFLVLGSVVTVCDAADCQADPFTAYDSINHHFVVAWEDARNGMTNLNVYAHLLDASGNPIGPEKTISSAANNQCKPWITFDAQHSQFLFVWEEGAAEDSGPFSIKARFFNANLDPVGSEMTLATGTNTTDYFFPAVAYSELSQRYIITWNDGDISASNWHGNVWARIIDYTGDILVDNFILKAGNFVRTDVTPYLPSTFLVTFDSNGDIWGKMVSSNGTVFPEDIQMSASSAAVADWAKITVGQNNIFVTWEDTRIGYPYPWDDMSDVYGNIWHLNFPGSSDVFAQVGSELQEILSAEVTSKPLVPENLVSWHQFLVESDGSITFNILDTDGTILLDGVSSGEDLSSIDPIMYPGIRAQAILTRTNPSYTPLLDSWSIIYAGTDHDPPETTIENITGVHGLNNWYVGNVRIILSFTDGQYGSGVNHTYFRIDQGAVKTYDPASGIRLPQDATGDPNTLYGSWNVWYWSDDLAGNTETPQGPVKISIDKVQPYCSIWMPSDGGSIPRHGGFWVQVIAQDNGSGVAYVSFDVGPPYENPVIVTSDDPVGSGNYKWYCDRDYSALQWKHIIAQAYDASGLMYEDNIYVHVTLGLDEQVNHGSHQSLFVQLLEWILQHLFPYHSFR
jgi:hypothetical protein